MYVNQFYNLGSNRSFPQFPVAVKLLIDNGIDIYIKSSKLQHDGYNLFYPNNPYIISNLITYIT